MWFYAIEQQKFGPASETGMRRLIESGRIGAKTLVWREGMADWFPLQRSDLAGYLPSAPAAATPPPIPQERVLPPPLPMASKHFDGAATSSTSTATPTPPRKRISLWMLFLVGWGAVTGAGMLGAMAGTSDLGVILFSTFMKGIVNAIAAGIIVGIIWLVRSLST